MSDARRARIDALFEAALDQDPADRTAWLDRACAGEPDIRREVDALLEAAALTGGVLDTAPALALSEPAEPRDRRIGPYRVVREIGRGGMGVVYLAERDDGQFRRRVALKLLRASPDARELHRRFLAERQILAALDHPNIAQLLDGGVADGMLPYLVIEYVDGQPITEYCDRRRLSVEARLRLFLDVCAAVDHAHRNLVLHRDLKPGNVLVTESGQVKLLDFGIAKLLNPQLTGVTQPVTHTAFRVLTPEYASPEQLRGEPLSTASDVYALGVVLYELLAGRRPHAGQDRTPQELARAIWEAEPVRPSAAVTGDAGHEAAARRDTTPDRLRRRLRGDLDAIVMMALRKEPNRRYASADLLAREIERHLVGRPVMAHKGSRVYAARKFVRRHAASVATAAAAFCSVVGGAAVALWQGAEARRERDRAELALSQAEVVTDFLVALFEAGDPLEARGDSVTARELLRRGALRIDALATDPIVKANLLEAMARVETNLGHAREAGALLERALALRIDALGEDDETVATTLAHLAEVLRRAGRYADGEVAAVRALEIQRRVLGPEHPSLTYTMNQIAGLAIYRGDLESAESMAREALALREQAFGADHGNIADALITLGAILRRRARYAEAETAFRRALVILERRYGRGHEDVADAMLQVAYLLRQSGGDLAEAESLMRQAIEVRRQALGHDHPLVAHGLADLGELLVDGGDAAGAVAAMLEHVEILTRTLGPEHPDHAFGRSRYAAVLHTLGRDAEARDVYEAAITRLRAILGADHGLLGGVLSGYAETLEALGDLAGAERAYRETIDLRRRALGPDTPLVYQSMATYARMLARRGRVAEAEAMLTAAVDGVRRTLSDDHAHVREILQQTVEFYESTGRADRASEYRAILAAHGT